MVIKEEFLNVEWSGNEETQMLSICQCTNESLWNSCVSFVCVLFLKIMLYSCLDIYSAYQITNNYMLTSYSIQVLSPLSLMTEFQCH